MAAFPWLTLSVVGVVPLALVACGKEAPPAQAIRPVLVQKVGITVDGGITKYVGEVRARYESDLGFRIPGKIVARLVDVGAVVAAGQPLARIDPADAALQAKQADANLALAESEAKRYRDLRDRHFVSQSALDAKETALQAAEAQAGLARNQSTYTTLTADHAGVVTALLAEVGQVVSAGQGVLRVARPEEKEVVISVPEGQADALRHAEHLTVTAWADPDHPMSGRLRELAPAADAATRTYTARISIVGAASSLALGMTASVSLPTDGKHGMLVPAAAVIDAGQGPAVWAVVDNKVVRRPIRIVQQREDGVLVGDGLQPGETIVVAGAHKLVADQTVRAQFADSASATQP